MNAFEWVVGGGVVAILGTVTKMYIDVNDKVSRAYKRLDEVKAKADDTYTRKDICEVVHKSVQDNLSRMDKSIVEGFTALNDKMDKLLLRKNV